MNPTASKEVSLQVATESSFISLVSTLVKESAFAYGLDEAAAKDLEMAAEHFFAYLGRTATPHGYARIRCIDHGYYMRVVFDFQADGFAIPALNVTASADSLKEALGSETEAEHEETHLLIASRLVDRFAFGASKDGFRFTLIKERTYPGITEEAPPVAGPMQDYVIRKPDGEQLKLFVRQVVDRFDPSLIPATFYFPGKVADMAAYGDYKAALAVDDEGGVGGGLLWKWDNPKIVECLGPYVLAATAESSMARDLLDYCISTVARSHALGIICRCATPECPRDYFEPLGALSFVDPDGPCQEVTAFYRHLEEDLGATVWSHPLMESFLTREYERLCLPREIRRASHEGERTSPSSVLSTEFDRNHEKVTLRPIWWGDDAHDMVAEHVEHFKRDKFRCLEFEIDLGHAWETRFTPALFDNGFEPRYILPYGGSSDLVVFEHEETRNRS